MPGIRVVPLADRPSAIPLCARWNYEQWGRSAGRTLRKTLADLKRIASSAGGDHAVLALVDDRPAGMGLIVGCDLETHAHLKPWVAGIYTAPEFRRRGVASEMLRVLEASARGDGAEALYLYTAGPELYERAGWTAFEQLHFEDGHMVVMKKQLHAVRDY